MRHAEKYITDSHYVCLANCELSENSGLTPIVIVIVIVIGCHLLPLFFSKVAPLFLDFSVSLYQTWIRHAFVMPSSCLRFLLRANFTPKVEARGIQNGMK